LRDTIDQSILDDVDFKADWIPADITVTLCIIIFVAIPTVANEGKSNNDGGLSV